MGVFSQYSGSAIFSNYSNLIYEGAGITDQNQKAPVSRTNPSTDDAPLTPAQLNGGSTIFALIVSVSASLTIDRFGRRRLFLVAGTGMLVLFACWTITVAIYEQSGEKNKAAGYTQIPIIWLFGFFYSIAWSGLLVAYAIEVLPFKLRAKGLMIMVRRPPSRSCGS